MSTEAAAGRARRLTTALREDETVSPLELFFDLVFVLAFTQCTALMADEPTWEGLAKGLLVLGVLWWSWVGYAWVTSVVDPEEDAVRLVIFAAMGALLIVALCVPEAFGDSALILACAYGVVRIAHIALFMLASRDQPNLRSSVIGLAISTGIASGLLVSASFADGTLQGALWALALVLDIGGPYFFRSAGWQLKPHHFAERHGLIVIIASASRSLRSAWAPSTASTPASRSRRSWGWRSRQHCGGCTSTSSRSSRHGGWRTPSLAASRTRWRATRTRSCTSRWWPASCWSRWG